MRRRVEQAVHAVGAEHVRDLVRVRDDRGRTEWQDEPRELVDEQRRRLEVQMRVDEKKYTLVHPLQVDRKMLNQWQSVEITFALSGWPVFRRDDNGTQLVVSTEDKFDQIRFSVRQQDVFGDARAYVVIDDIQVVEREKD